HGMEEGLDQRLSGLMRAAHAGDTAAYRQVLSEAAGIVRRVIRTRRSFLQPADVEDLVQDVLVSVHAARSTYDAARPFLPWLMAIVRHRLADGARRYARRSAHEVQTGALPETS